METAAVQETTGVSEMILSTMATLPPITRIRCQEGTSPASKTLPNHRNKTAYFQWWGTQMGRTPTNPITDPI